MAKSNIMISDFSGIVFDYIFLFNNPLLYVTSEFDTRPYDFDDVNETPWQFSILDKIGKQLNEENFPQIKEIITSASEDEQLKINRDKAKDEAWMFRGHSAEHVVDFLKSKIITSTIEQE